MVPQSTTTRSIHGFHETFELRRDADLTQETRSTRQSGQSLMQPVGMWTSSSDAHRGDYDSPTTEDLHGEVTTSPTERNPQRERMDGFSANEVRPLSSENSPTSPPSEFLLELIKSTESSGPRRFNPQIVETSKRSFRRATPTSCLGHKVLTEQSSGRNGVALASSVANAPLESQFPYTTRFLEREKDQSDSSPALGDRTIPSNSSEDPQRSRLLSSTTTPSTSSNGCSRRPDLEGTYRKHRDKQSLGYLSSLADLSVDDQLRDQALAAFPNEQIHQPPAHFAIDEEDEDLDKDTTRGDNKAAITASRRESSLDMSWQLEHMRQHKEEAEMRHRAMFTTKRSLPYSPVTAEWGDPDSEFRLYETSVTSHRRRSPSSGQMWLSTSPPMLGADLVFPQSLSPEATFSEGDQHLEENSGHPCAKLRGLWRTSAHETHDDATGLWNGMCRKESGPELQPQTSRLGLVTPGVKRKSLDDSDDRSGSEAETHLPHTPSSGESHLRDVDRKLWLEENAATPEFSDEFVTQIYNYLSLGYPSVARYFDLELSKISCIPVNELRRDDLKTDAKGYVGVSDTACPYETIAPAACMRWRALRLYIDEWARQQLNRGESDINVETWGVRERRGSWAL